MSDLNEEHVDAFFHEGDAGTYEGGPTLVPVGFDDIETEEAARGPSPEQLERRERYTRLVKKLVGSLAAASLVLFAFRAGRSTQKDDPVPATNAAYVAIDRSTPAVTPAPMAEAPKVEAPAMQPTPEPVAEPAVAPAAPAEPVAKTEAAAPATTAVAETRGHSTSVAAPAPHHAESRVAHADAAPKSSPSKASKTSSSSDDVEHTAALRPAVVTTSTVRSLGGSHAPPTATFPD